MTNDNSWQTVPLKTRKGKSNSKNNFKCHTETSNEENTNLDAEKADELHQTIINKIKHIVKNSTEKQQFLSAILDMLIKWNEDFENADLICYCLGSFDDFLNSKYQLAQLILFRQFLHFRTLNPKIDNKILITDWMKSYEIGDKMAKCKIFDPVFTATDKKVLEKFEFQVLSENNECRSECGRPTVFYMIHGVRDLHENLFDANYETNNLNNIFVVGNDWMKDGSKEETRLKTENINFHKIKLDPWFIPEVFAETFVYYFSDDKVKNDF